MTRPLNLGLLDALSRIGGFEKPELPALLEGIQPVIVYADLSQGVASEVFEARGIVGDFVTGSVGRGIELAAVAPGGIVIEQVDAMCEFTPDTEILEFGINIVSAGLGGPLLQKLDVGGVPTGSVASRIGVVGPPPPFGARLMIAPQVVNPSGRLVSVAQNSTRIVVPSGAFFQAFVVGGPFIVLWKTGVTVAWHELADIQGPQ